MLCFTICLSSLVFVAAQIPAAVYDGHDGVSGAPVQIRVATGGAGQSGILKALADAYINESVNNGSDPFSITWYQSDTFVSIQYLRAGLVDIGITYNEVAEQIAMNQGIAIHPSYYAWRDHFMLVGPKSNPANLSASSSTSEQFLNMYVAAEASITSDQPVRFLTRYDKSATNVKESQLWISISQAPWATAYSTWYHQYIAFPIQALTAAIQLGEYTLTDRGTFLTLSSTLTSQLTVFKAASDDLNDPLLNPAHILVSTKANNLTVARSFADWVVGDHGGQQVIRDFSKNGHVLYSVAPSAAELEQHANNACSGIEGHIYRPQNEPGLNYSTSFIY